MKEENSQREPWHLDKRVPIALIATVLVQTTSIIWWAATMTSRVESVEREVAILVQKDSQRYDDARRMSEQIVRLDERLSQAVVVLREVRDELKGRR